MKYIIISLLLIVLLLGWIIYDMETTGSIEKHSLEMEARHWRDQLDSANYIIKRSAEREIALKLRYEALQTTTTKAVLEAETNLNLYQREKKRKTGILSDSAYTATIDSLYPGR